MDETRTLPPLVHGKVTGVLDFVIDEIKIFRNIVFLTDNFDIIVQVQWWGEVLPAYIRPRKLHVTNNKCKKNEQFKCYWPSVKYEIKTTLSLFKFYLETCELLELVVVEASATAVIGSAFLNNLISIITRNNEEITMPLIDCSGEEIGEVKIFLKHTNVSNAGLKENSIGENTRDDMSKMIMKNKKHSNGLINKKSNFYFPNEKTIFADFSAPTLNLKNDSNIVEMPEVALNTDYFQEFECLYKPLEQSINKKVQNDNIGAKLPVDIKNGTHFNKNNLSNKISDLSNKSLPKIELLKDSSRVLHFELGLPKKQNKGKEIYNSTKNSAKTSKKSNQTIKLSKQPGFRQNEKIKMVEKHSRNISKVKEAPSELNLRQLASNQNSNNTSSNCSSDPIKSDEQKFRNPQNSPNRDATNKKVLDYLLGSKMTKEDEEHALNDFRKMSPSQDLVFSLSQLYSENSSEKSVDKPKLNKGDQIRNSDTIATVSGLNFNLNNTIERKYYHKFFAQTKSLQNDFEIAEFLNKPNDNYVLDKRKPLNKVSPNKSSFADIHLKDKKCVVSPECSQKQERDCSLKTFDGAKTCSRCNYYKKLEELDVIIESLKNFEKKMVFNDKDTYQKHNYPESMNTTVATT